MHVWRSWARGWGCMGVRTRRQARGQRRGAQASAQQCARGISKLGHAGKRVAMRASRRVHGRSVTGVTIHPRARSSPEIT
ncbi:hypothetical protein CRG98_024570 [Punica granatum]|uniref:Uncharacterized protein n=1 Tax=Punica granatum TaxID=22663 RepID=A0A2I0JFL1_PUNGR|nr:hypothetical protein CRG98_024570 [Punica granatum]